MTLRYHKTVGVVVVRFPVVLLIFIVVQVLTEWVIAEFPPFAIVDIFTLSSKVLGVEYMIHKFSCQDVVAGQSGQFKLVIKGVNFGWKTFQMSPK